MKTRRTPTKNYGLLQAKKLKQSLHDHDFIHVYQILLYGSVAREDAHKDSDIDIAIVCDAFYPSRVKEARSCYAADKSLDPRVELVILHPEDMENRYLTIAQEVKRDGVEV